MMPLSASSTSAVPLKDFSADAPYLAWPVSRREFYRNIYFAMLLPLIWGVVLFGGRSLAMLLGAALGVTLIHTVLKRWTPWKRAKSLIYGHSLVTGLVLVALSHPLWPIWIVVLLACLSPVLLALSAGPGKERMHMAIVLVVVIQWAIMPALARTDTYAGGAGGRITSTTGRTEALLARDRLLVGDLRENQEFSFFHWPASREIGGNDAFRVELPARVAAALFDDVSRQMESQRGDAVPMGVTSREADLLGSHMAQAFSQRLPGMDLLLFGVAPSRIGTGSFVAIVAGGLFLAYRYILRPRSVVFFLGTFGLTTLAIAFWPRGLPHVGVMGLWNILKTFPGELATLWIILLLNSDAVFAAIFILALPGTEPLTARGRRFFLVLAGFLSALIHRKYPELPAASVVLCALMPLTRYFDGVFARRSWLNTRL